MYNCSVLNIRSAFHIKEKLIMNFNGILLAAATFLTIGIFHPIVIKCEYHFSERIWPVFLICGLLCLALSAFIDNLLLSSVIGVVGCSCLWSIGELKEQTKRVEKGWFPENPKRKKKNSFQ